MYAKFDFILLDKIFVISFNEYYLNIGIINIEIKILITIN